MFYKYRYYTHNIKQIFTSRKFKGWGRNKTGRLAMRCHRIFGGYLTLLEDGFIRSIGLGIDGCPSFSLVEDDVGIYYDATEPSKLENILNIYDFDADDNLISQANESIKLILKHNISKYNNTTDLNKEFCQKYNLGSVRVTPDQVHEDITHIKNILIIAQTAGDSSLEYGLADKFSTSEMIQAAITENPNSRIYIKIHPDVLSGKKQSDISVEDIPCNVSIISEDVNPISLLKRFDKVYTKTSGMGLEALLVGCECVCFGMPFYAGWGITDDRVSCDRRKRVLSMEQIFAASYILYTRYYNPYTNQESDIIDTILTIHKHRTQTTNNKIFLFGFSKWKHDFIKPFLNEYSLKNIFFINPLFSWMSHYKKSLKKGMNANSQIYIWGKKDFKEVVKFAEYNKMKVTRVEDGFIRSVTLGSDLTRAYSLVFDDEGIYFDATNPSRLESILSKHTFTKEELNQASELIELIKTSKISKYNSCAHESIKLPDNAIKILVPGQVEDDASIMFGANGMTNIELLQQVRHNNKTAHIVYKPHPDVLSGNRVGDISSELSLKYCDKIITGISMASALAAVDQVHTMTSLTGLEGLLYGKDVKTYGLPFYAGWGLTSDHRTCVRRGRKLSLLELVAATYVLYPRYIHPDTLKPCSAVDLINVINLQVLEKSNQSVSNSYLNNTLTKLGRNRQRFFRFLLRK